MIYRFLTILSHDLRVSVIHARSDKMVSKQLISACLQNPDHTTAERLGDYLLLYLITKNVNPLIIKDVFERIAPEKYGANDEELSALKKSSAPIMGDMKKPHYCAVQSMDQPVQEQESLSRMCNRLYHCNV